MSDDQTIQMTQSGYEELQAELKELEEEKIPAATDRLALARSHGDLSENAEYHDAKEALSMLHGRRDELQNLLQRAKVVKKSGNNNGIVAMGSQVVVTVNGKDSHHTYHIVGEWEANPVEKKISEKSPLGQALVGKTIGEKVEVDVPAGTVVYHIQEVA